MIGMGFVSNVKKFDNYHITNGFFFKVMTINIWSIKILTNNHFQMEDKKKC